MASKLVSSYHPTILLRGFDVGELEREFRKGSYSEFRLADLYKEIAPKPDLAEVSNLPAFEAGHDAPDNTVRPIRTRNGGNLFLFLSGTGQEPENALCSWCRNPVREGCRWGIPVKLEEHMDAKTGNATTHVWIDDCTCGPSCSLALIRQRQTSIFRYRNNYYTDSESLLRHVVWLLRKDTQDGTVQLDPTPPNTLRADRGGPLQDGQFNGSFVQIPFTFAPGCKMEQSVPIRIQFHPARASYMRVSE